MLGIEQEKLLRRMFKRRDRRIGDGDLAAGAAGFGVVVSGTAGSGIILLSLLLAVGPARADCQPNPPASGQTVTCTGTATGFQAGADAINVTIVPGATVQDNGSYAIQVNGNNTGVANNGTVSASASGTIGIGSYGDNGSITNTSFGLIKVGNSAVGIGLYGSGITVANAGTITVGTGTSASGIDVLNGGDDTITNSGTISAASGANGIVAFAGANTITNSGTISIGDQGYGIYAFNPDTITNSGQITVGSSGFGVHVEANSTIVNVGTIQAGLNGIGVGIGNSNTTEPAGSNKVVNNGSVQVGDGGIGIGIGIAGFTSNGYVEVNNSNDNFIVNNGTITAGATTASGLAFGLPAAGIALFGSGNTISNYGTIAVGNDAAGIAVQGSSNSVTNYGTITASATVSGLAAGIDLSGSGNIVANNGKITVGSGAVGIVAGNGNLITNSGLIVAGANGFTIGTCGGCVPSINNAPSTNNTVVNNGTLDGSIFLVGSGNAFTNAGLISITDSGTAVGATHRIDGTFMQTAAGTLALRVTSAGVGDSLLVNGPATLGGTLRAVMQPGNYGSSTTYLGVVTSTNPITTTFAQTVAVSATGAPLLFFAANAIYNPTSVDLTLSRVGFGAVAGETQNERAIGNALDAAYSATLTGNAAVFFGKLLAASSVRVFDQLSGEGSSGTQQTAFRAGDLFLSTLMDQTTQWRSTGVAGVAGSAPLGYAIASADPIFKAPVTPVDEFGWRLWGAGFGDTERLTGDANVGSASLSGQAAGSGFGADHQVNPDIRIGFGVGASSSSFSVPDRSTTGQLEGGHMGVYGVTWLADLYAAGVLTYTHFDNQTMRTIDAFGLVEAAKGRLQQQ
jgi:uncharacterized protein with beta-barrel porin domain